MNARSRLMVGAAMLALGAGTLWIAATQSEADVRYVEQILFDPASHRAGAFTLMGIPEPAQIPVAGDTQGRVANPNHSDETRDTVAWDLDGVKHYSTRILRVTTQPDGALHWTFRNETRLLPTDQELAFPPEERQWTFGHEGEAFPVVGFTADGHRRADTPRIWAWYGKAPENPMQPKPSQFTGRLMVALPDGTVLPEGAHIYEVTQYTAGCSSKFLPPAAQKAYEHEWPAAE